MYDLFRTNFHQVDRAFKQQDRRMTGRFGKFQFGEILKRFFFLLMNQNRQITYITLSWHSINIPCFVCSCSAYTTPVEIDRLWESLYLDKDGLVTFTSLVRFFVDYAQDKGLPSPTEVVMPRGEWNKLGSKSWSAITPEYTVWLPGALIQSVHSRGLSKYCVPRDVAPFSNLTFISTVIPKYVLPN